MKLKTRILSGITAGSVAVGAFAWSAFADEAPVYKPNEGALLGVATHFHLFSNEVILESHIHGNVATNMLNSSRDFGVRPGNLDGFASINYIKDFNSEPLNEQTLSTLLVVGSGVQVTPYDNGNAHQLVAPSGGHAILRDSVIGELVVEDADTPYIDIEKELRGFAEMSETLAKQPNSNGVNFNFDMNHSVIDCSGSNGGFLYYTIDLSDDDKYNTFSSNAQLHIRNVDFSNGDFLYLNIEVGDRDEVSFGKSWIVYDMEGNAYPSGEVPLSQGGGRILYNIVSNGKPFEGKINLSEIKLGSFLVPKAELNTAGNTNGTIIADKIRCIGESHRWDVQKEGFYDKNDRNPIFDPDEEEIVTTTTTTVVTTTTPNVTTPANTTTNVTTPVVTTTPNVTTPVVTTTPNVTTPVVTTTPNVTTPVVTTTPNVTTPVVTTTPNVTTPVVTTTPNVTTPVVTTTPNVTTPVVTTTPNVTTPANTTTTPNVTTPVVTTTPNVTTPANTTTTPSETTPVVTTKTPSETTPVVTTTTPSETTPVVTTTTPSETTPVVTTTPSETTPVVTTTTSSETTPVVTTTNGSTTGGESDNLTFEDIKDIIEKLPDEIKTDSDADEYKNAIETIEEILTSDNLTSSESSEVSSWLTDLKTSYDKYTGSTGEENPDTGFGANALAVAVGSLTILLGAIVSKKKINK